MPFPFSIQSSLLPRDSLKGLIGSTRIPHRIQRGLFVGAAALFLTPVILADTEDAQRWLPEFQPSTLSQAQQLEELQWFIERGAAVCRHGD